MSQETMGQQDQQGQQVSWDKVVESLNVVSRAIEGLNLEALEGGAVNIEKAKKAGRKLAETLAGLYDIRRRGDFHPDLSKIPILEEGRRALERIPEVLPVMEVTDLRCRIEAATKAKEGFKGFETFGPLFQEAENMGAIREVGKRVEFNRQDGTKGTRTEFLPEANIPTKGIPSKVQNAQVWVYNPQTRETQVFFPRDWWGEDDIAVARALRGLYERARGEHREFKAKRDAQKEAERPYFEQSTVGSLDELLIEGKDGINAFGFVYRERFSDKPPVRGVIVVEAKTGKLTVKDFTPSFEGIEGLVKGAECPFTAGERPDLRKVPQPLKFMLFRVLDSIRTKAGGAEASQGKTGQEKEALPSAKLELAKPPQRRQKRAPKDRVEELGPKGSKTSKTRGGRAAVKASVRDEAVAGEKPEN